MLLSKKNIYKSNYDVVIYKSFLYSGYIFSKMLFEGNRLRAFNRLRFLKSVIKKETLYDPVTFILIVFNAILPKLMLSILYMGGSKYGVPSPITERKQMQLVFK
jgi:ribosomal protein S7